MNILVLLVFAVLGGPSLFALTIHEITRWNLCSDACASLELSNRRLLDSQMCSDLWERQRFGEAVERTCKQAEQELALSQTACTAQKFWKQSVFYELYLIIIAHPLFIFATICVGMVFTIYQLFSSWQIQRQEERSERMFNEALSKLPTPAPAITYEQRPSAKEEDNVLHLEDYTPRKRLQKHRSYVRLARPLPCE